MKRASHGLAMADVNRNGLVGDVAGVWVRAWDRYDLQCRM